MSAKNKAEKPKVSKAKKIYNIISTIITVLIFCFLIFVLAIVIWSKASGSNKPIFGSYVFDVVTGSMEPTIKTGETILCKEIDDVNSLEKDDIITFVAPSGQLKDHLVTHRIYQVFKEEGTNKILYIKTKGDAAPSVDEWNLDPKNVVAKYSKTLKGLGEFRSFLLTPTGYVVLIFLPLLIVGILFICSFVKTKTEIIHDKEMEEKAQNVTLEDLSDEEKQKLLDTIKDDKKDENHDDNHEEK